MSSEAGRARIAAATAERLHRSAVRALDDPAQLARAARIIKVALERKKLTLDDVLPDDQQQASA